MMNSICFDYPFFLNSYLSIDFFSDLSKEQHACEVCDKAFARESLLKEHMKVHEDRADGSQKLICHLCCVPFKSKKFLERHIKLHASKPIIILLQYIL